jgi:carbamoyltransferase
MNILGISAFYHDSAAALVRDGEIVAAAQEERFTRKKHDASFPAQAVEYCLKAGGLGIEQVNYVVFYEKPLLKFDRLLETYLAFAPRGFRSFSKAMPLWLKQKLYQQRELAKGLGGRYAGPLVYTDHHESHAASAFFPSPYDEAAILTLDGVGEWATASVGVGRGNRIELLKEMHFPHSVGLLYSAFTYYCGFKVNSGEYKLMGLAPYGEPIYRDQIRQLVEIKDDGSVWMDMSYFNYCQGLTMTSEKFHRLFGGPPRDPETDLTQRHMDIGASIQAVTEEIMLKMARHVRQLTGLKNLCLAGGVALNCVGNGKIVRERIFDDLWIQPAAGDAGGALGGALFVWHQLLENKREPKGRDAQHGSLIGPQFSTDEVEAFLKEKGAAYRRMPTEAELLDKVTQALVEGKVVGWVHGRMEYGPRALGARSILGDARHPAMQSVMNRKIKFRESFRPFAPCVLLEDLGHYFDLDCESPYMLLVAPVLKKHRTPIAESDRALLRDPDLRKRVNLVRSTLPAITHVDYSARIQTVDEPRHGRFHRLMKQFKEKTGCGVIVNTSFNIRGEPIVCTPAEAYNCFLKTYMDVLVLEDCVLYKTEQPNVDEKLMEAYRREFPLD